jgi:hypothetical protein
MKIPLLVSFVFVALILCAAKAIAATTPPNGAVLTWHNDNFRTGWQQQERILTTSTIGKLGISHAMTLNDRVSAQPLVIPSFINGHDIAFVVDESNNLYQIDANTGTILKQANFGLPVPENPGCGGGPRAGIGATPVIDWASQTLFVLAYVNVNPAINPASPAYFLHALDLVTLNDKVFSPHGVQIAASHTLTNGAVNTFNPKAQRSRAALLFANNQVYAAFSSWCDTLASISRGWVLGWSWNGTTLAALPATQLTDRQPPGPYHFLDTIWMSGAGVAGDEAGNLFFVTGNSFGGTVSNWTDTTPCLGTATGTVPTNVGCSNVQESVVKLKGDLTEITGLFSPNAHYGSFSPDTLTMDNHDEDLGSGGVLLVPQRGSAFLAAVAGKDGRLFLFDRSETGLNGLKFLQFYQGLGCWCAPSYFTGPDGVGRIVTSQGKVVQTFKIPTTNLSPEGTSVVSSGQDPGFFTTVSCNGDGAFGDCTDTPIIWAVSRPLFGTSGVDLWAFSGLAVNGGYPLLLGPTKVGNWSNSGGNANVVPTVSNGLVYIASDQVLTILRPGGTGVLPAAAAEAVPSTNAFSISGTLDSVNGSTLTLTNRKGEKRLIDDSKAIADGFMTPALITGDAYTAFGSSLTSTGVLQADAIYRAKCRQHNEVEPDLTGAKPACTGDQWPPDKDSGQ